MKALVKTGALLLVVSFLSGNVLAQIQITPNDIKKGDLESIEWEMKNLDLEEGELNSSELNLESSLIKSDLITEIQTKIANLGQKSPILKYSSALKSYPKNFSTLLTADTQD